MLPGETVNIAARLEGLAQPNTVVISNVTARLVERVFALDDLGLQQLKGIAESIRVFRVLDPLPEHIPAAATATDAGCLGGVAAGGS
jgi:class 3 adenylate cyclase